jgi:hypothetical protein
MELGTAQAVLAHFSYDVRPRRVQPMHDLLCSNQK